MAKLTKKIYMTNSAGTQQTATLYSATADVGSNYAMLYVDSTNCYVPLVSTSATTATSGRVIKNGTTYAIGSSASVAYDYREFKTATSGTFTVPSGVYKLRVTCVGGGSGGVCVARNSLEVSKVSTYLKSYSGSNGVYTNARFKNVDGSTTTFGSVSASGGYKAYTTAKHTYQSGTGDSAETVTCFYPSTITTNVGYTKMTMYNDADWHAGASAVPLTNIKGTTVFSAGAGGPADGGSSTYAASPGSSGVRTVQTISVSPGDKISWTVGNYGQGLRLTSFTTSTDSNSSGIGAGRGNVGGILVEWGEGIA